MAKSKRTTDDAVTPATNRAPEVLGDGAANGRAHDIAARAYDLYLARACEHGHDVEDWLQAEHDMSA